MGGGEGEGGLSECPEPLLDPPLPSTDLVFIIDPDKD